MLADRATLVIFTGFTVTTHWALRLPDAAVITAVPADTPVTRPLWFTVATLGSELLQETAEPEGFTLAFSTPVLPTCKLALA